MQVFIVRGGKLIGQEHFILDGVRRSLARPNCSREFCKQFYTARTGADAGR